MSESPRSFPEMEPSQSNKIQKSVSEANSDILARLNYGSNTIFDLGDRRHLAFR